ncbi:MAG TPA: hypothetical protein VFL13_00100 [Candidatus Baltobacteraceae bacterium]|nr:hypothetical protein [Candidatus Baltobacteraceae bacterium]
MRYLRAILSISAVLMLTVPAAAQVESTPIPALPKPDFSAMSFLVGTWNCSTMSSRRSAAFPSTVTTTMSEDGYWMVNTTVTPPVSWAPAKTTTIDKVTYDPSTSRWVDVATDDQGGYDLSTSAGWHGNSIVWDDVAYPKTNATATNNPLTVTKVDDKTTTSMSTFKEPGGRTVTVKTTCKKQG